MLDQNFSSSVFTSKKSCFADKIHKARYFRSEDYLFRKLFPSLWAVRIRRLGLIYEAVQIVFFVIVLSLSRFFMVFDRDVLKRRRNDRTER